MSAEVEKAIITKAKANSNLNTAIGGRIFYALANNDTMPYIVFQFIGTLRNHTFGNLGWDDYLVQFSIFDKSSGVDTIESIGDKLTTVFDNAILSYDTRSDIGCQRQNGIGPEKLEDCWMMSYDYLISVQ